MKKYTRLTKKERYTIEQGICTRKSIRQIAKEIDRPPKTISKEIIRNGGVIQYYAEKAHDYRTLSNRKGYSKIERSPDLKGYILNKLKEGWSPGVIAGRWNKEHRKKRISPETIYQWIYNQKNNDLIKLLPRKKKVRGNKRLRQNRGTIDLRVDIDQRPKAVETRERFGDCEGDLMFQKGNQSQSITTVIERKSRFVTLRKNKSKHTDIVMSGLQDIKKTSIYSINTMTFDNGKEFAKHFELGISTYFCHPGSPWQKGSVEHMNGIIRQYLDYRVDLKNVSQHDLDVIAHKINSKPRKILNFLSPYEVIQHHIKKECSHAL